MLFWIEQSKDGCDAPDDLRSREAHKTAVWLVAAFLVLIHTNSYASLPKNWNQKMNTQQLYRSFRMIHVTPNRLSRHSHHWAV